MTENEIRLIDIIRVHKHPTRALIIAVGVILGYLGQGESSATPSAVGIRERV